jgi:hypothetical protein
VEYVHDAVDEGVDESDVGRVDLEGAVFVGFDLAELGAVLGQVVGELVVPPFDEFLDFFEFAAGTLS